MKPIYKLSKWIPIPYPKQEHPTYNKEMGERGIMHRYWIGLAHNLNPGIEKYLIEEIEDYVCFEDGEEFESIDFWRGVSANPNMVDYFLNNPDKDFDGRTTIKDNIRWNFMLEHNSSPLVVDLCIKYPEQINWVSICRNQWNERLIEFAGNFPNYLSWKWLNANPTNAAVEILKLFQGNLTEEIVYNTNPNAFELLEKKRKDIPWHNSHFFFGAFPNRNTVRLYEKYFDEMKEHINWEVLSKVPEAIDLLEKYPDKIDWKFFCLNPHIRAIKMIKENKDKIDWQSLSKNNSPHIVDFLDENLKYVNLNSLIYHGTSACLKIFEQYWDHEDYRFLFEGNCRVPEQFLVTETDGQVHFKSRFTNYGDMAKRMDCIHLLKDAFQNGTHLIYMRNDVNFLINLYSNPAIFELDQEAMKAQNKLFAQELMAKVYHPQRVSRIIKKYKYNILTEESCYPSDSDEETEITKDIPAHSEACH